MPNKDLEFLKEMHGISQSLLHEPYDIVKVERLDKMIEDWRDELQKKEDEKKNRARRPNIGAKTSRS